MKRVLWALSLSVKTVITTTTFALSSTAFAVSATLADHPPLSLSSALSLLSTHPQWEAAEFAIEQARAEQMTAQQYLNPSLDLSAETRDKQSLSLAFPIETARVRQTRLSGAIEAVSSVEYEALVVQRHLIAQIKQAYYLIHQREEELRLADQELDLLAKLRYAIQLRVSVGEAPKYELVKAEAELLGAQIQRDLAYQELLLAKELLAERLDLSYLPDVVAQEPEAQNAQTCLLPKQEAQQRLQQHPLYLAAQAQYRKTQALLGYEMALVTPQPTLIVGTEMDMGIDRSKLGVSLPLPLWHQRDGQIATAMAKQKHANALISQVERQLSVEWAQASLRYQVAETQVRTYQTGLLKEAESAFKVAQAAYKHGERGILDFIDAQRILANVKRGFVKSQYEQKYACIDIEQLTK